ncbi:MAG: hypothetical protein WEA75_08830 [Acidimicrobiia bacterium]
MSANTAVDVHGTVDPAFERVADAFAANFAEHGEIGAAREASIPVKWRWRSAAARLVSARRAPG